MSDQESSNERPDDIVGHKTFREPGINELGFSNTRHEPITRAEADAIIAEVNARRAARAAAMPDEKSAIKTMFDAFDRLRELGWREAVYCPKDGSPFEVIEPGSTGIFRCHYEGEWPDGSWWLECDGDIYPSRPILFRLYPEDEAKRKAAMEAARVRYQEESRGDIP